MKFMTLLFSCILVSQANANSLCPDSTPVKDLKAGTRFTLLKELKVGTLDEEDKLQDGTNTSMREFVNGKHYNSSAPINFVQRSVFVKFFDKFDMNPNDFAKGKVASMSCTLDQKPYFQGLGWQLDFNYGCPMVMTVRGSLPQQFIQLVHEKNSHLVTLGSLKYNLGSRWQIDAVCGKN
jgi:hypothetical protein